MNSKSILWKVLALIGLAAILASCGPTPTVVVEVPTTNPQPTFNAIQTQAVQTALADLTKNAPSVTPTQPSTSTPQATATPAASATPAPATNTPLPPTATRSTTIYPTWTPVVPTLATYSCTVTSTTPATGATFIPRADFDGNWVITNTGSQTWIVKEVDIVYVSGTTLQKRPTVTILDLSKNVLHGETYTVIVDMTAPTAVGSYTTTWAVKWGNTTMCTLNLDITVK